MRRSCTCTLKESSEHTVSEINMNKTKQEDAAYKHIFPYTSQIDNGYQEREGGSQVEEARL
jgi:hypothetical protein